MQPEYRVSRGFLRRLNNLPECWAFKVHGSEHQTAGVPDILCCYRGVFVGIEVKMPGNKPSPVQRYIMDLINGAQGIAIVAYRWGDVQEVLDQIDQENDDE